MYMYHVIWVQGEQHFQYYVELLILLEYPLPFLLFIYDLHFVINGGTVSFLCVQVTVIFLSLDGFKYNVDNTYKNVSWMVPFHC